MEATKPIEEMSDAEISKAIKDEIPFICYRDIYRPVISERLKQNQSYCRVKQLYTEAAKGLREVLGILDEQPETADQFPYMYKGKFTPVAKAERGKIHTVFTEKPKRHSQKPEISYEIIERLYPEYHKDILISLWRTACIEINAGKQISLF